MRLVVTTMNLGLWAAAYIKEKINAFSPTPQKPFVLGLPTGGTMVDMYANLRLFYKEGLLDFQNVVTFNMDEYAGLPPDHPQSYHSYMRQNLFDEVNLRPENTHILNGQTDNPQKECEAFEAEIARLGGIDLFVGGVGRNGHIAFNEPGSAFNTRTRPVVLAHSTIEANSRFFLNDQTRVPKTALSVGIGTVTDAKEVLFIASGEKKAHAVARVMQPGTDLNCPLTALKIHPHATLLADPAACSSLTGTARQTLDNLMTEQPTAAHWTLETEAE